MCVKKFLGFICGHCSIPSLIRCPLSLANQHYPACKIPAEWPIFTNDFCHPCSRVVWNERVLREENEHKARHMAGECECEVIFEGEDREKRTKSKGKNKKGRGQNGVAVGGGRNDGHDGEKNYVSYEHYMQHMSVGQPGFGPDFNQPSFGQPGFGPPVASDGEIRRTWEPEAVQHAQNYVGYYINEAQAQYTPPAGPPAFYDPIVNPATSGDFNRPTGLSTLTNTFELGSGMKFYPENFAGRPSLPSATPLFITFNDLPNTHDESQTINSGGETEQDTITNLVRRGSKTADEPRTPTIACSDMVRPKSN